MVSVAGWATRRARGGERSAQDGPDAARGGCTAVMVTVWPRSWWLVDWSVGAGGCSARGCTPSEGLPYGMRGKLRLRGVGRKGLRGVGLVEDRERVGSNSVAETPAATERRAREKPRAGESCARYRPIRDAVPDYGDARERARGGERMPDETEKSKAPRGRERRKCRSSLSRSENSYVLP